MRRRRISKRAPALFLLVGGAEANKANIAGSTGLRLKEPVLCSGFPCTARRGRARLPADALGAQRRRRRHHESICRVRPSGRWIESLHFYPGLPFACDLRSSECSFITRYTLRT